MPDDGHRLVHADGERAERGVRPEIAQPPLVPLDLFAHPRQLLLHIEHVLELAGPGGEQVDEPRLEPPRVGHPGGDIHVLLADVLRAHVHGLELPDRGEAGQRLLEAIGRDLDLEACGAELAASGLHRGVGDVAAHPAGERPHHRHRGLERVYFDACLSGANDHARGRVSRADRETLVRGGARGRDGRDGVRGPLEPYRLLPLGAFRVSADAVGRGDWRSREPLGARHQRDCQDECREALRSHGGSVGSP